MTPWPGCGPCRQRPVSTHATSKAPSSERRWGTEPISKPAPEGADASPWHVWHPNHRRQHGPVADDHDRTPATTTCPAIGGSGTRPTPQTASSRRGDRTGSRAWRRPSAGW